MRIFLRLGEVVLRCPERCFDILQPGAVPLLVRVQCGRPLRADAGRQQSIGYYTFCDTVSLLLQLLA